MSDNDLIRRGDVLALPHKLSPSLDADDGYFVSVDAIRALPAATTFTAADVERAWEMGRDAAADMCRTFSNMDHIAQDMELGIFPQQSERQEAISRAICALTPPADLAQRVKE